MLHCFCVALRLISTELHEFNDGILWARFVRFPKLAEPFFNDVAGIFKNGFSQSRPPRSRCNIETLAFSHIDDLIFLKTRCCTHQVRCVRAIEIVSLAMELNRTISFFELDKEKS